MQFFIPIIPPTVTAQQKGARIAGDSIVFFTKDEVRESKVKLRAHLAQHRPASPIPGPLQLVQKWIWPNLKKQQPRPYWKDTRPDCDNVTKLLQDVMEDLGYFENDAKIASLVVEKFYGPRPGIYIEVNQLEEIK